MKFDPDQPLFSSDISTIKEIKAQPIFSGSQQLTKHQHRMRINYHNPNDIFVNTTESKICGVPATIKANNTATTSVSPRPSSTLS